MSHDQIKGMGQLLGQSEHRVEPLQGRIRIAQKPQGDRRIEQPEHPRIDPIAEGQGLALLRLHARQLRYQMFLGRGQVPLHP